MSRKLLFFDIDGTLLCGGFAGYIPGSALEALKRAQKNGHYVFINTGRAWSYLPRAVKDYPFDGYLCGCGTYVILHDQVLFRHVLPDHIRESLPDLMRKYRVQGILEGVDSLYADLEAAPFPPAKMICDNYKTYNNALVKAYPGEDLLFEKFDIIGDKNSLVEQFREDVTPYFHSFGPIPIGDWFFEEFIPASCSKAKGIDLVTGHLHLSTDDCYVFGDGPNDMDMMKHAGHSIAMGNSAPEVLETASYVTTPANRDGICNAMIHYGLI